jgi:hypothetical protein
VHRRDINQNTGASDDRPAEMPVCDSTGMYEVVSRVPMTCTRPVLAPFTKSSSGGPCLTRGSNKGWTTGMSHGDIQHSGTMGQGKGRFKEGARPLTAKHCNCIGCEAWRCTRIATRIGEDVAERFLALAVSTRMVSAEAIATHAVVDIAAVEVPTTKTRGGGDM